MDVALLPLYIANATIACHAKMNGQLTEILQELFDIWEIHIF